MDKIWLLVRVEGDDAETNMEFMLAAYKSKEVAEDDIPRWKRKLLLDRIADFTRNTQSENQREKLTIIATRFEESVRYYVMPVDVLG